MKAIRTLAAAVCVLCATTATANAMLLGVPLKTPPVTAAPEPATLVLMGTGLAAVGLGARRMRRKRDKKD